MQLKCGADVNQQALREDWGGVTPLLLSVQQGQGGVSDMVHLLLCSGADVNAERRDARDGHEVPKSEISTT